MENAISMEGAAGPAGPAIKCAGELQEVMDRRGQQSSRSVDKNNVLERPGRRQIDKGSGLEGPRRR